MDATQPAAEATSANQAKQRTLLAIGDLHSDYYRMLRYLRELDLIMPDTLAWNPEKNNVDVIFIGDYVDWRGEPLEAPNDQLATDFSAGPRKIIEFIIMLTKELELLRKNDPEFDSYCYPLVGNHDEMMLCSTDIFKVMPIEALEEMLKEGKTMKNINKIFYDYCNTPENTHIVQHFLNWFTQGGSITIASFGSFANWKEAMEGEMGRFMRNNLYLAIVVNNRLFAHSLSDDSKYWRPVDELAALPESEYAKAKDAYLWGRKVWGFDFQAGGRTSPFTEDEIDNIISKIGCKSIVVGHTPISRSTELITAYNGKVINIDVHGFTGGKALVETYTVPQDGNKTPLRS